MLTCIIVAHKRFEHYKLEKYACDKRVRIVMILPEYADSKLGDTKIYVDKLYVINEINFNSLKVIVEKELHINNSINDIKLLCNDEIFLSYIGEIRKVFGIDGATNYDYIRFRDKITMKKLLSKNGVPVPKFLQVNVDDLKNRPQEKFSILLNHFDQSFFVKPICGASSIGAYHII